MLRAFPPAIVYPHSTPRSKLGDLNISGSLAMCGEHLEMGPKYPMDFRVFGVIFQVFGVGGPRSPLKSPKNSVLKSKIAFWRQINPWDGIIVLIHRKLGPD